MTSRENCEPNTECSVCEEPLYRAPSKLERLDNAYCSDQCYQKDKGMTTVQCDYCEDEMRIQPWRLQEFEKHFCSNDCQGLWTSENKTYESPYGKRWYRIRRKVKKRDNHNCVVCGKEENLEVHHVVPASKFDEPEKSHQMKNLVTLCAEHHVEYEGNYVNPRFEEKMSKEDLIGDKNS